MKKWEYKALPFGGDITTEIEKCLNEQGEQGWELVCFTPATRIGEGCYYSAVLKREVIKKY